MANIKFVTNPNVTKPNYSIQVLAKDLFLLGWDFEADIQALMNTDNLTFNSARLRVLSTPIRFHFEQNETGQNIFFWYFATYGADYRYTTGTNSPIDDLLILFNDGLYTMNSIVDYSEDLEGKLCDFLITESI